MKNKTNPLTRSEKQWLKDAQLLFNRCPDRFEFITHGDADLTVIDGTNSDNIDLHDGGAHRAGIVLELLNTKARVHGVSG